MSRKIQFACLFLLLGLLSAPTQSGFAQNAAAPDPPPLNFGNNFFVTGDYVVAGAQGMTSSFTTINGVSYARGTITIPDANPNITGTKSVPQGAQIVAALLYWQTVEKIGVTPGGPESGQNGFFKPVGGPQGNGYAIAGVSLTSAGSNTVSWSSGGCTTGSTGKIIRTYRADVRAALPQDASGDIAVNPIVNGKPFGQYQVILPGTPSTTPIAVGATLVIIYRVLSPDVPLNSIVIYDGDFAPSSTSLIMSQNLQGFYQAADNPVSRLTHIVGNGKSKKGENVYLNSTTKKLTPPNGEPPFPGYYGTWDNTTWTFSGGTNPVAAGSSSAMTRVEPASSMQGCVSWGAVIVSTTVKNSNNDGLLDVWKTNKGYCDVAINQGSCGGSADPSWVSLDDPSDPPSINHKDVFVQLDYLCNKGNSNGACAPNAPSSFAFCSTLNADGTCLDQTSSGYSFNPYLTVDANGKNVVQKVVDAFANSASNHTPIHLHVIPTNAIQEPPCTDDFSTTPPTLCPYPNQPGVVGWPGGVVFLQNQLIDANGNLCFTTGCGVPVFQQGKRLSYHYALWGHALGLPNWTLQAGLATADANSPGPNVKQVGNSVTFKTSTPHGLADGGSTCLLPNTRVSVAYAITNLNLNGTFCVQSHTDTTFTINIGGNGTNASYTRLTDPSLAVASGQAGTVSGFSAIGGQHSVMTLGSWGPDGRSSNVKAGTFMHELGHSIGLTHFGLRYPNWTAAKPDYTPGAEVNCKSNYHSVMNYLFQIDLLGPNGVLDFSSQELADLNENSFPSGGIVKTQDGSPIAFTTTSWYDKNPLFTLSGHTVPSKAAGHCDGSLANNPDVSPTMYPFLNQGTAQLGGPSVTPTPAWSAAPLDLNFDGKIDSTFHGHNDWMSTSISPGINLQQVSATGTLSAPGLGGMLGGGGGTAGRLGGGGGLGGLLGGGGGTGGRLGGGGGVPELNRATANVVTRPPTNLTATEGVSPRIITLNWTAPSFGQIGSYNVYRSAHGDPFTLIGTVTPVNGTLPTTFTDTVTCDPGGFRYLITAVLAATSTNPGQESAPSNTVPAPGQTLTGCYNVPSVLLVDLSLSFENHNNPPVKGDPVSITWSLINADTGTTVTTPSANTQITVIGPIPPPAHDDACPSLDSVPVFLNYGASHNGAPYLYPFSTLSISPNGNQFTSRWETLPPQFTAGCYVIELDLDSIQVDRTPSQLQISVAPASLPDGLAGTAYDSVTFTQSRGVVGPFTWTVDSGANTLPPGLTLSTSGALSGTPTKAGTYHFEVKVTDGPGNYGKQAVTLHVAMAITPKSLQNGVTGSAYDATLSAIGAPGAVAWSVVPGSGSLPPGINLGANSGTLSGTPTNAGTFAFTVQATSAGEVATQMFTLNIADAAACAASPSGLLSWYPLNGNALDIRGGKPGAVIGVGSQFVPAETGQGFKSGGPGSLIVVPGAPYLNPVNFTVGAWLRVDQLTSTNMPVVWQGNSAGSDITSPYSVLIQGTGNQSFAPDATQVGTPGAGKILVIISDGVSELDVFSNAALAPGAFHYVSVTWDGANGVGIFVDGILDTQTGAEQISLGPSVYPYQIGGIQNGQLYFGGVIDELQIWGHALTAAEISGIASAAASGQCSTLWFTEQSLNRVGRINRDGSAVTGFPITLTAPAMPYGLTVGPDGNVWVAEYGTGNIAVITPAGAVLNEYPTPLPNPNPTGLTKTGPNNITAGPDGNLWFTEWDVNQVASITTTGTVNAYSLTGSNPWGITAGPDGNIWFTELNGNMIGKVTPSGVITEYPIPTASSTPAGITTGPDGNIWFTEWGADKIGVFSPSSPTVITEYTLPANTLPPGQPGTSNSGPQTITVGSDGNLWFTETNNDKIGKITPAGVITEYPVPAGSYPFAIVAGLDGNLWFTEPHRNIIGRMTPSGVLTEFAVNSDNFLLGITVGP